MFISELEDRIKEVAGCLFVMHNEINGSTYELRLIYTTPISLGDLVRGLSALKRFLRGYGLKVVEPSLESVNDDLHLVVKVVASSPRSFDTI